MWYTKDREKENQMSREERFGCTPNWTEDMIRFIRDFWNQIPELEFELIHI